MLIVRKAHQATQVLIDSLFYCFCITQLANFFATCDLHILRYYQHRTSSREENSASQLEVGARF